MCSSDKCAEEATPARHLFPCVTIKAECRGFTRRERQNITSTPLAHYNKHPLQPLPSKILGFCPDVFCVSGFGYFLCFRTFVVWAPFVGVLAAGKHRLQCQYCRWRIRVCLSLTRPSHPPYKPARQQQVACLANCPVSSPRYASPHRPDPRQCRQFARQ